MVERKKQPRQTKEKGIRTCSMTVPILLSSDSRSLFDQLGYIGLLDTCHSNKCMFDLISLGIDLRYSAVFLCCSCSKSKSIYQNPIIQTVYLKVNMLDMSQDYLKSHKSIPSWSDQLQSMSSKLPCESGFKQTSPNPKYLTRIFPWSVTRGEI